MDSLTSTRRLHPDPVLPNSGLLWT
jgi:hypothetical protein